MKQCYRLLLSLFFIILLSHFAYATPITISSYQITNWQYGGTSAQLRIYVDTTFVTSDGKTIQASNPLSSGGYYLSVTVPISGTTATIPQFTIDSTTDGQTVKTSKYLPFFYNSNGKQLGVFSPFENGFFVTPSPGTTQTWSQIAVYATQGGAPPGLRYTFDDDTIQRLIAGIQATVGFTNPMTTLGDIITGGTGGTATRLGIGAANTYVQSNGTTLAYHALNSSDITTALTYTPLNKAGDTMTGALVLSGAPTIGLHATTKTYVDGLIAGKLSSINGDATVAQTISVNAGTFPGLTITDNAAGDHKLGLSGALATSIGGTGLTTFTGANRLLYSTSSSALATFPVGGANTLLKSNGTTFSWAQVDLTTDVVNSLSPTFGGTGSAFTQFSGASGSIKTYALPNASTTILTTNSTITVPQGGTGLTTFTGAGYIPYSSAATTLAALAPGTANQLLHSGSTPTWSAVDLNADTTGTLSWTKGGTGATGFTAGYIKSTGSAFTSLAVPIPVTDGGTGITSATSNGVFYYTGSVLATTAAGAANTVLTGTGAAPAYSATPSLIGVSLTGLGLGSVPFVSNGSGLIADNNTKFFWDNTNFQLNVKDTLKLLGATSGYTSLQSNATLTGGESGIIFQLPPTRGTAGQLLGINTVSNNAGVYTLGLSWQTVSGGGGGSGITSLNTLTATSQTLTLFTTGASTPSIVQQSASENRIIIPLAGSGVSGGLVTNAAQTFYGSKTFNDFLILANGTTSNPAARFACTGCSVQTSSVAGDIEWDATNLYLTNGAGRKTVAYRDSAITDGQLSANVQLISAKNTNNGYAGLNAGGAVDLARGGLGTPLSIGAAGTFLQTTDGVSVSFSNAGGSLTNLNGSNISQGTVAVAYLPATIQYTTLKDAVNGYAGLTAGGKLNLGQMQEVMASTDLSDFATKSGVGTAIIGAELSALANNDILIYNSGTNKWVNTPLPSAAPHNILSATHGDTVVGVIARGDLMVVNATPAWQRLAVDASNRALIYDGATTNWGKIDLSSANFVTGVLALGSHAALSSANQVLGVNAANTASEWKTLTAGTNVTITYPSPGNITIAAAGGGGGTGTVTHTNGNLVARGFLYGTGNTVDDIYTTAAATDGQLLIGRTGNIPLAANLTASTGVTVTNGAGSITLARDPAVDFAFTVAQTITRAPASNTSIDGKILTDTTAATLNNQQFSPRLRFTGQGWQTGTSASQTVDWIVENQPVQGSSNPSTNLVFSSQVNGGGYTARATISSAGVLTLANLASGLLTSASGVVTSQTGNSGGIPYFNASSTLLSSAALTANGVLLGGGAGSSPTATAAGTADQVLVIPHAGGAPAFGQVDLSLSAAVKNALTVGNGGTGLTSGTSGGIPYFNATSTMLSSAALAAQGVVIGGGAGAAPSTITGSAYQVVRQNSAGTATAFGAIDISQSAAVTGTLAIANGGTNLTSFAKGDLPVGNAGGTGLAKLAVGTDTFVLTADSASTNGVKWAAISTAGTVTNTSGALTANSFVFGNGTNDIKATAAATSGQLLIGSTGGNPVAATLTAGTGITVSNGAGSITLARDPAVDYAFTVAQTITRSPAANTSIDGEILTDTTAATLGNQQFSPRLRFTGQGWQTGTGASQTADWINELQPVQGASLSSNLIWASQINAGGYTTRMTLSSAGVLTLANLASGLLTSASGVVTSQTGTSGGIPYWNSTTTLASSAALTANGVLLGGGAGASPTATAAGTADQVLVIPHAGGAPNFSSIDLSQSAAVGSSVLGTANGGTGQSLAVVPDKQGQTAAAVTGDGTEQTGYTYTIPANSVSSTGVTRLRFMVSTRQGTASTSTWVIKVKLGGTTLFQSPSIPTTSGNCVSYGEVYIGQESSTSTQGASTVLYTRAANPSSTGAATNVYQGDVTGAAVNMTSNQALVVTVTETLVTGATHGTFSVLHAYTEIYK